MVSKPRWKVEIDISMDTLMFTLIIIYKEIKLFRNFYLMIEEFYFHKIRECEWVSKKSEIQRGWLTLIIYLFNTIKGSREKLPEFESRASVNSKVPDCFYRIIVLWIEMRYSYGIVNREKILTFKPSYSAKMINF